MGKLSRWWLWLTPVAAAVVLAGCTADEPDSGPSPTPAVSLNVPPTTAAPTDPASNVQAAKDAYAGMWDAYMRVLAMPDPDSPELTRFATGSALKTLADGVRDVLDQGLKGEGRFVVAPQVTEIAPASAPTKVGIRDCVDTTRSRIVRASPGPAYSDTPGGRRLCQATVERQSDGSWKVSTFGLHEVGTCG